MNDDTTQKESLSSEIKRLAKLDPVAYELTREEIANKFKIRVAKLDEFVEKERKTTEEEKPETILFPKIDPWPDAVLLPELLNEIVTILNKYVSFISEHEPKAIALWIIHSYCIEAAYITPILFITSAEMRSGKSTLLAILQKLSFKCLAASSISPSVIYRIMPKYHPTLVCDEADTYLTEKNEDLRGIFNAGHSRDTSGVFRTNPDTLEVERFDAFGAKCIAAIKRLPGTVEDRSIIIPMRRMVKGNKKAKMRLINAQLRNEFHDIQRKCVKFVNENIEKLETTNPSLPDKLNDRAADNWFALFQIASLADAKWQEDTKKAALHLSGGEQESKSLGIELLEDILNLFDGVFKNCKAITTVELIGALCSDEEAPWITYNFKRQDTKITSRQLATLLAPYGIKSINNVGIEKLKGYSKADFQDAFSRYIHSDTPDFAATSATSAPPNNHGTSAENEEKESSATIRSSSSQYDTLSQINTVVADSSGTERQKSNMQNTSQPPSNIEIADVAAIADKSSDLGAHDYIDV